MNKNKPTPYIPFSCTIEKGDQPIEPSGSAMSELDLAIATIGEQNDHFRNELGPCEYFGTPLDGKIILSSGIAALPKRLRNNALLDVRDYLDFPANIDPCAEHNFGTIDHPAIGNTIWVIDYFTDASCEQQADDRGIANGCYRTLTIMLAEEY